LGMFSVLITILWVVGITNAINLIDGLDGLATGVSTIGLISILIMAITDLQIFAVYLCVVLIGANLGFLYHNFYPAKIYMGDTGSNFLGYMIAVISMLGLFKNVALFSFIIPIIVIALPILDTLFSIIRRMINKQKIMEADNKHIHYQLLRAGFTHRQSVLVMYGFSLVFGVLAIVFAKAPLQLSFLVAFIVFILVHVLAEVAGIVRGGERPLVNRLLRIVGKNEEEHIEDIKQKTNDESEQKNREH
ncbi:MAG TPA: MraY family glycosyltransferase, partial [Pseudogracilibacillus sp.]|nr:MraY family glycosyltransferase [Pseudogracilibacillus sp.]